MRVESMKTGCGGIWTKESTESVKNGEPGSWSAQKQAYSYSNFGRDLCRRRRRHNASDLLLT